MVIIHETSLNSSVQNAKNAVDILHFCFNYLDIQMMWRNCLVTCVVITILRRALPTPNYRNYHSCHDNWTLQGRTGHFWDTVYYVVPIRWHLILPKCSSNLSSNMRPDYKKIDTTNYFLRLPPLRLLVVVPGNMAIVACDGKWEPRWSHCNTSRRHSIIIHSNSSTSQQLKQLSKFISQLTRLPNTKLK